MGWDTRNLFYKFNSQGSALKMGRKSQVSVSQFQGLGCQGPVSQGLRVVDPGSQVLILDYAHAIL